MPNGIGMTMTGKNTSGDRRKCDDNRVKRIFFVVSRPDSGVVVVVLVVVVVVVVVAVVAVVVAVVVVVVVLCCWLVGWLVGWLID